MQQCPKCSGVVERSDIPHMIRKCPECGREMHVAEFDKDGKGMEILEGDRFVVPSGWLTLSLNPILSRAHLFRPGIDMIVKSLFIDGLVEKDGQYMEVAKELEHRLDQIVNAFPPLSGFDINDPADGTKIWEIMQAHGETPEFWAFLTGQFLAMARAAIQAGDAAGAAWATGCAERFRAVMLFKRELEEPVWMGQSVRRILDILRLWDANRNNSDEEFWQRTFKENAYVLSQVFAVPMIFIKDKAYVGGMNIERSDARFVDYLFSAESSREAILIEIKTPTTPLFASEYRDLRPPSRELSGSVLQVSNYRGELTRNLRSVTEGTGHEIASFIPRCALIAGNAQEQIKDARDRRSFELYRAGLSDVELLTYDELFRKVEILAELFSLKKKGAQ